MLPLIKTYTIKDDKKCYKNVKGVGAKNIQFKIIKKRPNGLVQKLYATF